MPRLTIDIPDDHDPHERATRGGHGLWGYWSKSPWATVLWASVMVWCIATMPGTTTAWPASAPRLPGGGDGVPRASLVRRAGVIVAVAREDERPDDTVIGTAWYDYRLRPEFEQQCVTITGSGVTAREVPAARAAYVAYLKALPGRYWQSVATTLAPGDQSGTVLVHGRRVAQSVLALLVLPLAARSLAWMAPIVHSVVAALRSVAPDPVERERRRRKRRLDAGQCPECGYCILSLPQRRCPECGATWTEEERAG